MKLGFIGLGNMGAGMAENLLNFSHRNGHLLHVLDINQNKVEAFVSKGAIAASSIADLACNAEVLFTSLPSFKEINAVALGDKGLLNNMADGAAWFETSTNELSEWQSLRRKAKDSIILVDAPVTGGAEGAEAGSLTMLLGIDQAVLYKYSELLASFTDKAVRMGPSGAGYVSKLCQLHLNYLVAQGIGEALMLGAKADLDLTTLHDVLQTSCAQSYVVDHYVPKILDGSYDKSFSLGLAAKDMRLISALGEHLDVPTPLADKVYSDYQEATKRYGENEPHLKIVRLLEDRVGRLLR